MITNSGIILKFSRKSTAAPKPTLSFLKQMNSQNRKNLNAGYVMTPVLPVRNDRHYVAF